MIAIFKNKKMKINFNKIGKAAIYTICVAVLILVFLKVRFTISSLKEQVQQVTTAHNILQADNNNYQTLVTRLGDSLKMINQVILSQKQAIEMGILERKELKEKYLKEVDNVVKLSEEVKILNQKGKWVDTVFIDKIESKNWLEIPADMVFTDQWYKINITADKTPLLNSLTLWSEPTITIGTVKKGLFKKPQKVNLYENANPYIELKSAESVTIKEQQKWYQTTKFKVGAGFILGVSVYTGIALIFL